MSLSPYTCCINGGGHSYNGKKCADPYWQENWANRQCDSSLAFYCAQGNNLFSSTCRAWMNAFPKGNRQIDPIITEKCSEEANSSRPECACITAVNDLNRKMAIPTGFRIECVSNACSNAAFRTTNQLLQCPEVINCSINIVDAHFVMNNSNEFNQSFVQQCGSKIANNDANNSDNTNQRNRRTTIIVSIFIIVAFILVILFVGLLIYFLTKN